MISAVVPDPLMGPHAVEDARHMSDALTLTPLPDGSPKPIPIVSRPARSQDALGRGAAGLPSASSTQKREVFGFATYWNLSKYAEWDMSVLSTIAYFGLTVNPDGSFVTTDGGWTGWNSANLTNLVSTAHASGVKVVLVIKDFSDDSINMVISNNRQTLINNIISAIQTKNLDGVNIDFEAVESPLFPNLQVALSTLAADVSQQVHAKWPQAEVSMDTYAGSASWDGGVFKIGDLAPWLDAFFIMAYDSVFENMPGQAGPNAPMTHWTYNDTVDVAQYLTKAPASKIILGVPYYGYRWSTVGGTPRASTVSGIKVMAEGYSAAMDDLACAHPAFYQSWDDWGQSPWASWWSPATGDPCGDNLGMPQELYYDDATSLGIKYDLVNQNNLRGTGIWALGYDTGRTELWGALHTHFSCPVSIDVPTPLTTEFKVNISAGTCSVAYYDVQQYNNTTTQGWFGLPRVTPSGGTTTTVAEGYPGQSYQFQARATTTSGLVSSWATITVTVPSTAMYSQPFKGLYTLDPYGGISPDASPPLATTGYWQGWKIAKSARTWPSTNSPQSGFVLDGFGGLHPYGASGLTETSGSAGHYWGFDIARDFAFLPDGTGGFVLDGYGGLHPFRINGNTAPLQAQGNPYWAGTDVARKVVIFPDGSGGYVMDAYGGLSPFGINGAPPVTKIATTAYWKNWGIARDVVLVPGNGNHSGYVLDGYGGLHPFFPTTDGSSMPSGIKSQYWGWDIARAVFFIPGSSTAGYTLDGYGGLTPFGGAAAITNRPYWAGWDIAIGLTGG